MLWHAGSGGAGPHTGRYANHGKGEDANQDKGDYAIEDEGEYAVKHIESASKMKSVLMKAWHAGGGGAGVRPGCGPRRSRGSPRTLHPTPYTPNPTP